MEVTVKLEPREKQLVRLISVDAMCAKDIGAHLGLSHNSIKVYTDRLYKKLGIHSRLELFRWAHQNPEAWA